jgi:hypothetical protein
MVGEATSYTPTPFPILHYGLSTTHSETGTPDRTRRSEPQDRSASFETNCAIFKAEMTKCALKSNPGTSILRRSSIFYENQLFHTQRRSIQNTIECSVAESPGKSQQRTSYKRTDSCQSDFQF